MGISDYLLELYERGFGGVDGAVCMQCVYDVGLREQLSRQLTEPSCSFCGRDAGDGETQIATQGLGKVDLFVI